MSQMVETTADVFGDYKTRWACTPPSKGVPFRVLSETWNDAFTERTIWGIALADEHSARLDRAFGPEQEHPKETK